MSTVVGYVRALFLGAIETQPLVFAELQVFDRLGLGWLVMNDVDRLVVGDQTMQARQQRVSTDRGSHLFFLDRQLLDFQQSVSLEIHGDERFVSRSGLQFL